MSHARGGDDRTILVFNVGSSSLTFKLYRDSNVLMRGKCHRVGITGATQGFVEVRHGEVHVHEEVYLPDHLAAARYVLDYSADSAYTFDAVGHRFADGGGYFDRAVEKEVKEELTELGIEADIEEVKDMSRILQYKVIMTPGLVIDGKMISSGHVPSKNDIRKMILEAKG